MIILKFTIKLIISKKKLYAQNKDVSIMRNEFTKESMSNKKLTTHLYLLHNQLH